MSRNAEQSRLDEARDKRADWKKWGPYQSERQWGTVREDYSDNGDAWNYFSRDQARSHAYRWGEDGLAGISDDHQVLCFALALWNGRAPILNLMLRNDYLAGLDAPALGHAGATTPKRLGSRKHPPGVAAPGEYVMMT